MQHASIALAALSAFVLSSGIALAARADQPMRCEVTREGKKEMTNAASAQACAKMGGTVVAEKDKKEKQEKPQKEKGKETN